MIDPYLPEQQVAIHRWFAFYKDEDYEEEIVLEIRRILGKGFLLHTRISQKEFNIFEPKFFYALETFFSHFPLKASITLKHKTLLFKNNVDYVTDLYEKIIPEGKGNSFMPQYQFKLKINEEQWIVTPPIADARAGLELLSAKMYPNIHIKICSFCNFSYDHGVFGHTDGRHDLLYCFRDNHEALKTIRTMPFKSPNFPHEILSLAMQDVDALHTCASFAIIPNYDSLMHNIKERMEYS